MILYQAAKRLEASRKAGVRPEMPAGEADMEQWLLELADEGMGDGTAAADRGRSGNVPGG